MAQAPISEDELQRCLEAVELHGSVRKAAIALGLPRTTLQNRLEAANRPKTERPAVPISDPLPDQDLPI